MWSGVEALNISLQWQEGNEDKVENAQGNEVHSEMGSFSLINYVAQKDVKIGWHSYFSNMKSFQLAMSCLQVSINVT